MLRKKSPWLAGLLLLAMLLCSGCQNGGEEPSPSSIPSDVMGVYAPQNAS